MRKIIYLFSLLALLSLSACATEKHTHTKGATTMQLPPAYGDKPNYRLKIEGFGDKIEVFFNGVEIFHDFGRADFYEVHPINNYVASGENELRVRIFAKAKQQFRLNSKGHFDVAMQISDASGEWRTLSHLRYDASAKSPLAKSTYEGYYTLEAGKGFKAVALPAEAEVSRVEVEKREKRGVVKIDTKEFIQKLTFPTPFPRWKFLDSEDIIDGDIEAFTDEEYEKFRQSPKMQKLYDAYEEIMGLIKAGKYNEAVDKYSERINEYAYAWRDTTEALKKSLISKFETLSNDPNYELVPFERDKKYFFIEENRKIAYIPGTIKFKKKGVFFYSKYGAKFRWDGKKWILTR
jgi:hypothetical protein